jgi:hypothetical protein
VTPDRPTSDETTDDRTAQHPAGYYVGANNARWVVIGFIALIVAFVIYMALGMPGMNHGGGGGMDHDMGDMDSGEMLP